MVIIQGTYDPALVSFSILAAIIAAFVFIDLVDMYLSADNRRDKIKWRIFSATSLGLGIWIMHFIGMFAYKLPVTVHYDGSITFASLMLAIVSCLIGVKYLNNSSKHIVYAGVFMGAGIAGMHYLGMYGMHMSAGHVYDSALVIASILVAMVVSGIGLLIVQHICKQRLTGSIYIKLTAATIIGLAISSMHYIGMAAITFVEGQAHSYEHRDFIIDSDFLMGGLVVGGMILLVFSFYTVASERSLLNKLNAERQLLLNSENRLSTLLDHIADAVAVINERGIIELFNRSAEQMFGYEKEEVLGKNISILMTGGDRDNHDEYLHRYMETGESKVVGQGTRQLTAVNKNGNKIFIGLSTNKVETDHGVQFIGVMRDMTDHRRELDKLTQRADYDSLTGLMNRHQLFARLKNATTLAKRNKSQVCFMFIDLDGFKTVNDDFGHDAGDELLRQVAMLLTDQTREADIVSRFGGDEFCILLEEVKGCEGMQKLAEKILVSFQGPFHISSGIVNVTTSIGIAFYPDDSENDGDLIKHADSAMYEAKKAGKNQYKFYDNQCCEVIEEASTESKCCPK
ncbi:MAG: diguanylate cyclase [Gammaproteobacteria bacterium]|nr:diguanylate cyclase [Gammaproteobacteria bacterium]